MHALRARSILIRHGNPILFKLSWFVKMRSRTFIVAKLVCHEACMYFLVFLCVFRSEPFMLKNDVFGLETNVFREKDDLKKN